MRASPKCPFCGAQPCKVGLHPISFGENTIAGVFMCGECEMILSVAPLPTINMPEIPQPKLVMPS